VRRRLQGEHLLARACQRVLKLARTIADGAGSGGIPSRARGGPNYLAEIIDAVEKLKGKVRLIKGGGYGSITIRTMPAMLQLFSSKALNSIFYAATTQRTFCDSTRKTG
jgi:hypothetical protein